MKCVNLLRERKKGKALGFRCLHFVLSKMFNGGPCRGRKCIAITKAKEGKRKKDGRKGELDQ